MRVLALTRQFNPLRRNKTLAPQSNNKKEETNNNRNLNKTIKASPRMDNSNSRASPNNNSKTRLVKTRTKRERIRTRTRVETNEYLCLLN